MENYMILFKGPYFGRITFQEDEYKNFKQKLAKWLKILLAKHVIVHQTSELTNEGVTSLPYKQMSEPYKPLVNHDYVGLIISIEATAIEEAYQIASSFTIINHNPITIEIRKVSQPFQVAV